MSAPASVLFQHQHWCRYYGHDECCGVTEDECDCGTTQEKALLEQARRIACSLESELAEQADRVAEAKGLLSDALVWLDDRHDNVRDYVLEAISALEVKS